MRATGHSSQHTISAPLKLRMLPSCTCLRVYLTSHATMCYVMRRCSRVCATSHATLCYVLCRSVAGHVPGLGCILHIRKALVSSRPRYIYRGCVSYLTTLLLYDNGIVCSQTSDALFNLLLSLGPVTFAIHYIRVINMVCVPLTRLL